MCSQAKRCCCFRLLPPLSPALFLGCFVSASSLVSLSFTYRYYNREGALLEEGNLDMQNTVGVMRAEDEEWLFTHPLRRPCSLGGNMYADAGCCLLSDIILRHCVVHLGVLLFFRVLSLLGCIYMHVSFLYAASWMLILIIFSFCCCFRYFLAPCASQNAIYSS